MKANTNKDYLINVRLRQLPFFYKFYKKPYKQQLRIIGLIRERNESLLLKDTLDHISRFVDGVIVLDDASTDSSVDIARNHPIVIEVIKNRIWRKNHRIWEETSNRKLLHERAKQYKPEWFFYFDADERFEGDIKDYLLNKCPTTTSAIKISLFDAYITKNDKKPFTKNKRLYKFRKYFGPERRDILMIWRNGRGADFLVPDAREPQGMKEGEKRVRFYCQHYGKALSIEHWEETCRYYINHFPKYSEKWRARIGKAVHSKSDFGLKLYTWAKVKDNSIDLKEISQ